MKGEKGEGKIIEPMFPRLHVNDREKGGPRAPPRNKMALYEQLSIPSSCKFSSVDSSVQIPLPNDTTLVRSTSLSQGNHQRTEFAPSDLPPQTPAHSTDRIYSQSLDSTNLNSARLEFGRPPKRQANENAWNASKSAGSSHQQVDSAFAKKSFGENCEDEDDFRVPTFVHSGISVCSGKNLSATDSQKLSILCSASLQKRASALTPNSSRKGLNGKYSEDMRENIDLVPVEAAVVKDSKGAHDAQRFTELSSSSKKPTNKDNTTSLSNVKTSSYGIDAGSIVDNSRVRQGSFFEASAWNNQIATGGAQGFNLETENNRNGTPVVEDMYRNGASESSTPESIPDVVISPDDVVGVIGPKHFWKARRAIVNQQRIFAIQVFELHRLIKVQKLLAASPDVIKVDVYLTQSPEKEIPEDMQPEDTDKSHQPTTTEQEASSEKPDQSMDCEKVDTARGVPMEPVQVLPAPGGSPCFHPQLNQWLFPVMSPSEGLIYKPCPPPPDFMPTLYANCPNFPQAPADFMHPVYRQQPPFYFPSPYGPMMSPDIVSASVALQQSKGSCDGSNRRNEVILLHFRKSEVSRGGEVQEGNSTSQFTKESVTSFPPFRDSNCSKGSLGTSEREAQSRVIRVVPHNARLATESAARIFRSIQEERKRRNGP